MPTAPSRSRPLWAGVREGAAYATCAGLALGSLDFFVISTHTRKVISDLPALLQVLGLNLLGVWLAGIPLMFTVAIALTTRPAKAYRKAFSDDAQRLTVVVWSVAILIAMLGLWWFGVSLGIRQLKFFHNGGLAVGTTITALLATQCLLAVTLVVALPKLIPFASRAVWLQRKTRGRRGPAIVFVVANACVLQSIRLSHESWLSSLELAVAYEGFIACAVVTAFIAFRPFRLVRPAIAAFAALVSASLVVFALCGISTEPSIRASVSGDGAVSRFVLHRLYRIADRDGDGFPALLGGADCDDTDPAINPLARETTANGIDENCTGSDSSRAQQQHRAALRAAAREKSNLDVVLITVDSLRPDHLGAYGYHRAITPNLDSLARKGTRFVNAECASPSTRRSLSSLLFGRYSATLSYRNENGVPILQTTDAPTIATVLRAGGYTTHVIMPISGLLQDAWMHGFSSSQVLSRELNANNASAVTDAALKYIAVSRGPSFTWVHYYDAHAPYDPPLDGPELGRRGVDLYDGEVWAVDREIGRLMSGIESSGLLSHAIVIVTADHGEAFDEHGHIFHGRSLYEEETRVPLLILMQQAQPRVIVNPVSLTDLAPTVFDAAGITSPGTMNGRSLLPAVERGIEPDWPVLTELSRDHQGALNMLAVSKADQKLIWNIDDNQFEAYRLDGRDRTLLEPHEFQSLRATLGSAMDAELSALPAD